MRINGGIFGLGLICIALSSGIFAQNTTSQVKSINAYCKQIDVVQRRRKTPELVYANTADINSSKAKWRKFVSEKALDKFREGSETYDIAYNWRKGRRLIATNFTHFSPSGDWVKYVNHCFRADGTLARVETDYRTFNGDFKVVRHRYFDGKGRQISSSVKYLDLTTDKAKDHSGGVMGDDPHEIDYYKRVKKLPFARLLPK